MWIEKCLLPPKMKSRGKSFWNSHFLTKYITNGKIKIESGKMELYITSFEIEDVIDTIKDISAPLISKNNVASIAKPIPMEAKKLPFFADSGLLWSLSPQTNESAANKKIKDYIKAPK